MKTPLIPAFSNVVGVMNGGDYTCLIVGDPDARTKRSTGLPSHFNVIAINRMTGESRCIAEGVDLAVATEEATKRCVEE